MENVEIVNVHFYRHLINFMAIWYLLWSFVIFFTFWCVVPRRIWQPCVTMSVAPFPEIFVTLLTRAVVGADGVSADVLAAAVVRGTLVLV
jgi:hypothetical protein